jgi:glycosyltransferase involved in cell wall biosynthesis
VLFVGSLWYPPNRHGIEWFLAQCWPAIAGRCPGLELRLVGPAPAADRARWARAPRTAAPGFVEDLAAEYASALFAIAPVLSGGGTSIKFLESAAHRRACVVTQHVCDAFGADFPDDEATLVARSAPAMIEACVALANDRTRREAVAGRAQAIVTSLYTVERFERTVRDAVRALLSTGIPDSQPRLPRSQDLPT